MGDEPVIIARRTGCPTLVAADRVAAARKLIARGADVIVADDGLQHLASARDCAIAVIDGAADSATGAFCRRARCGSRRRRSAVPTS